LSYEKGINTLLEVFAAFPDLRLKVVGAGPKENELKRKEYKNVEFLGFKSGRELYDLVRNARFVCVPSEWYENNPMTVVEAYSMGVPVIGARIGGIPEIVEEGITGFLFDSGNKESLIDTLRKSLDLDEYHHSEMKKHSRQFADKHFNKDVYVERLLDFYNKIITDFKEKR